MGDINFSFDVPRGRERFRELIVYISQKCSDDPTFGATKLNKILFYSDLTAYEKLGQPLTGLRYFRLDRGPAARAMIPVRNDLIEERAITVEERPVGNRIQKRTVALRDADLSLFTKGEIAIVDQYIGELWAKSAAQVSEESHRIAWHSLSDQEQIPYEAAFLSDEGPTERDVSEARKLNEQYGWQLRV